MMLLINSMNSVVSGLCALFTFGATLLHSVNAQSVDVTQVVSSTGEDCSTFSVGSSATLVMNITAASAPSWILNLNFNNVLIGTIAFPPGSTLFPNVATSEYSHRVSVKLSTTTVISRSDFFMGNLTLFELQSNESNFKFTGTGSTGLPLYFDTTLNNIQLCAASGQGVIESCSDSCVYNSSVTLSCSPGYSSSSIVTQCGDCGNFIDPLFCSPETCNALSVVDNPTMNTTLSDPSVITVNFSDIVNVTCAEGYNGTGASYMCASNDTFDLITNAPNCPIVTCDASLVLDNSTTATEKTVSFNSTLNVACNTNFTGTSGSYICNKNGNFNLSVEPTCKPVSYEIRTPSPCPPSCYIPIIVVLLWVCGSCGVGFWYYKVYAVVTPFCQKPVVVGVSVIIFPCGLVLLSWQIFFTKDRNKVSDSTTSTPKLEPLMHQTTEHNQPNTVESDKPEETTETDQPEKPTEIPG